MAETLDDPNRRDFIYIATGALVAVGGAACIWPFIDQMNPDASTLSLASLDVDLEPVAVGEAITVMWRGKPVFVRHRTAEEIESAKDVDVPNLPEPFARNADLPDNAPATDADRTKKGEEEWIVLIGICTHLGCIPKGQRAGEARGEYDGWFCPCHGSHYDTSGRIRKGPASENMAIPPYAFIGDAKIKIG